uniref:NADH-ubiquinone oxidoreductase chain 6 n=1 Tax=Cynoglossus zanzibarensis TaxID=526613 RepID=A0A3G0Z5Q9_9PLEU|nr:NADH dehydrogenase subunit 6 [Cynoglossus zanzibarensis]AID59757.1 NADH dehydrogenase subunit 6 [Cynoglossus zanzibarensis]
MSFIIYVALLTMILGLVAVASNPSPYFAALGLVLVAGASCVVLVGYGGTFLSLVLFLIYLGGMLVVFAYTTALAADPYPESLGSPYVLFYASMYILALLVIPTNMMGVLDSGSWWIHSEDMGQMVTHADVVGLSILYSGGSFLLVVSAWMLLLTLFVVLELTRGMSRGTLRAV